MSSVHSGFGILCKDAMFEATAAITLSEETSLRTYVYIQMMAVEKRWKEAELFTI